MLVKKATLLSLYIKQSYPGEAIVSDLLGYGYMKLLGVTLTKDGLAGQTRRIVMLIMWRLVTTGIKS